MNPFATLRHGWPTSAAIFRERRAGRVAFLGGSITAMDGWRELTMQDLQRCFPATNFDFINAGIASLGSTPHAFRLARDVLSRGPVDLLFVEAAVNDSTNGFSDKAQVRAMEGIVRHARRVNPATDIVFLHFVDPEKMDDYRRGTVPPVIANHERVATHYGIPSLNLAREVTERIDAGEFTWEQFRDLHPSPFGHEIYARSIHQLFDDAFAGQRTALPAPLDPLNYSGGRLVPITDARLLKGWTLNPNWTPVQGETRQGFVQVPMLTADLPGATLTLDFSGTAVGIFVAAGYDAGTVEFAVDEKPVGTQNLFTKWSADLHLPWAYVLADELNSGPHQLTLRIAASHDAASRGHAVRIAHFLVNDQSQKL